MPGEMYQPLMEDNIINISVLVVDDDSMSLEIIARMLQELNYQVTTAQSPIDALGMMKNQAFDLVLSDVYMPEMTGFELQKHIDKEHQVPVVLMSADSSRSLIERGLKNGAAFYFVKPLSLIDLRDLWQHAITRRKCRFLESRATGTHSGWLVKGNKPLQDNSFNTSTYETDQELPRTKTKEGTDNGHIEIRYHTGRDEKRKMIWTKELQNRFMEAVHDIGLENVSPKKILNRMNVPNLTRENVASHLQKYRIHAARIKSRSGGHKNRNQQLVKSTFKQDHIPPYTLQSIPNQNTSIDENAAPRESRETKSLCDQGKIISYNQEILNIDYVKALLDSEEDELTGSDDHDQVLQRYMEELSSIL